MDRVLPNPLLIEFFSTDETIIYQLIVQSLTALAFLNEQGMSHQDLMPHNIIFEFIAPQNEQTGNFA
jgi:serine/threonine protein kinase